LPKLRIKGGIDRKDYPNRKKIMTNSKHADDVDQLIERVIKDEHLAEVLKKAAHDEEEAQTEKRDQSSDPFDNLPV
jgi:dsDNA-binding SOS-regulon protein